MTVPIKTSGILIISDNKVLLIKHTSTSNHQEGFYGIPAGKVMDGETELDTAVRKLFEETGLVVDKKLVYRLPRIYKADILGKNGLKSYSITPFISLKFEGTIIRTQNEIPEWISIHDIDRINLLPNMRLIIQDGNNFLEKML